MIAAVVRPFHKWRSAIERFVFVTLAEHEAEFSVRTRSKRSFPICRSTWCVSIVPPRARHRRGAYRRAHENIRARPSFATATIRSTSIRCSRDPLARSTADCLFPIWSLRGENLKSWSVAACASDLRVTAIAEKELPAASGDFFGVVGCYYLRPSPQAPIGSQSVVSLPVAGDPELIMAGRRASRGEDRSGRVLR